MQYAYASKTCVCGILWCFRVKSGQLFLFITPYARLDDRHLSDAIDQDVLGRILRVCADQLVVAGRLGLFDVFDHHVLIAVLIVDQQVDVAEIQAAPSVRDGLEKYDIARLQLRRHAVADHVHGAVAMRDGRDDKKEPRHIVSVKPEPLH